MTHAHEDGWFRRWQHVVVAVIGFGVVTAAVWLVGAFVYWHFDGLDGRGDAGAAFTIVGAYFSALAFAALVYALYLQARQVQIQGRELRLQRRELKLQRRELALTRAEVQGQKEQLVDQSLTMRLDVFERAFFQLLALNREALLNVSVSSSASRLFSGHMAIAELARRIYDTRLAREEAITTPGGSAKFPAARAFRSIEDTCLLAEEYLRSLMQLLEFCYQRAPQNWEMYVWILTDRMGIGEKDLLNSYVAVVRPDAERVMQALNVFAREPLYWERRERLRRAVQSDAEHDTDDEGRGSERKS